MAQKRYTEFDIDVLESAEQIRQTPGMWVGDRGAFALVKEILDNAVDEHLAGHNEQIEIEVGKNRRSIRIRDYGRGIPVGVHPKAKIPTVTAIFTTLFTGAKFKKGAYQTAGGLHGVGAVVSNALSSRLEVEIARDGAIWRQTFSRGNAVSELVKDSKRATCTGTTVTMTPDRDIFDDPTFDLEPITCRLAEIAYLCPGLQLKLKFQGAMTESKSTGLEQFAADRAPRGDHLLGPFVIRKQDGDEKIEAGVLFVDGLKSTFASYCNVVGTSGGGTHLKGFKEGLSAALIEMGRANGYTFTEVEALEGVSACVHVRINKPKYDSQAKDRLVAQEVRGKVASVVKSQTMKFLKSSEQNALKVFQKAAARYEVNVEASDWKAIAKRIKSRRSAYSNVDSLIECTSRDPAGCELFIVEGDSAGGNARQARDPNTQAILPLKGKIRNVHRTDVMKALDNESIRKVVQAIGCNVLEKCDPTRARYGKIIILCDGDPDGAHISCLLCTLFHVLMRPLIEAGMLYQVEPPLFGAIRNKRFVYGDSIEAIKKRATGTGWQITRFKGLGEMDAWQLGQCCMDERTRLITRIKPGEYEVDRDLIDRLMGSNSDFRKELLFCAA